MKCITHSVEMREIPAGISKKTGKPYNAFMACPEKGCRETFNPKDSTERGTKKVASAQGNSTGNYAKNQAAREDGMAFLNASRGAVEIVVAKMALDINPTPKGFLSDAWIAGEVKKWTAFLYEMNTGKNVEPKKEEAKVEDDSNIQF